MDHLLGERDRLGPYRLVRLLGRGGMAEVYLAIATGASGFEKEIALKTLRPELVGNPIYDKQLIAEAKLGARLRHRNLIQVHELGVDEGVYYVRMDLIDGGDLRTRLRCGSLPVALALLVAEELLAALGYIHGVRGEDGQALGLLHRDVSPANVLLSRQGEVKLADLGLAKATSLQEVTQANVRKGTYAYMSPEQVTGAPLDAASDQFSFAITLYELLTGERPFDGATPHETMQRIAAAELPPSLPLPPDLEPLLRRCLTRDPRRRHPSTGSLEKEIRAARRARPEVSFEDLATWYVSDA